MPIDYSKYPPNWKTEIRPAILERAEHHCENCGVKNYAIIIRRKQNPARYVDCSHFGRLQECKARFKSLMVAHERWNHPIKVILTIAHLNHDTTDNRPENLKALCQRCHLNYDRESKRRSLTND